MGGLETRIVQRGPDKGTGGTTKPGLVTSMQITLWGGTAELRHTLAVERGPEDLNSHSIVLIRSLLAAKASPCG